VFESAGETYRHFLVRWVDGVRRRALLVVAAAFLLTLASGAYLAGNIRISTDTTDMLSPDLPFRQNSRAVSAAFPQFSDNILVVVDGHTPDLADDAARNLVAGLRAEPRIFGSVFDPAGDPFFRRNGLLYLDLDELSDLSDRLAEAQPFLGTLWRDPSLRGFFDLLGRVIEETVKEKKGDTAGQPPVKIAEVFNSIAEVAEAQTAGKFARLSWHRLMLGKGKAATDPAEGRRFILIKPVLDFASLQPAAKAINSLRAIAADLELGPDHGVRVRLTGSAALAHEELNSVQEGMGYAGIISLSLVIVLLILGLRSLRLVGATLVTLIMGLIWTAAFAIAALAQLNLISVAFAVLFIGLSVDFGIHFGLRYQEGVDAGDAHADALRAAAGGVGGALSLCAVSAAIAFYSFLPTAYLGLAELGLIAGTGMFIALFANMTVLPALLTFFPLAPGRRPFGQAAALQTIVRHHPRWVAWSALAIGVAAVSVLPQTRFDFDPMNLRNPETESVSTLFDLMSDSRNHPYSITVLAPNLEAARKLGKKLAELPEVRKTSSLLSYLPDNQDEKLQIIDSMALYLSPAFSGKKKKAAPSDADRAMAISDLAKKLRQMENTADQKTRRSAQRLGRALATLMGQETVSPAKSRELETRLLGQLSGRLDTLRLSLNAAPVGIADLPPSVRERQIAPGGQARLDVFPSQDPRNHDELVRFVAAVRALAPDATGAPVVIFEAGKAVIAAFRMAAVIAVAAITVLLMLLLGRVRDAVLVFAPLILAAVLSIAASVVIGLPFNFANVIVLPLLFGLGVASGIHLVLRDRAEAGADVMATSTPRAVMFSALTTIGSFGSIAISSHPGTASMGTLLTIAISLTLLCTLLVLPALMAIWAKN